MTKKSSSQMAFQYILTELHKKLFEDDQVEELSSMALHGEIITKMKRPHIETLSLFAHHRQISIALDDLLETPENMEHVDQSKLLMYCRDLYCDSIGQQDLLSPFFCVLGQDERFWDFLVGSPVPLTNDILDDLITLFGALEAFLWGFMEVFFENNPPPKGQEDTDEWRLGVFNTYMEDYMEKHPLESIDLSLNEEKLPTPVLNMPSALDTTLNNLNIKRTKQTVTLH